MFCLYLHLCLVHHEASAVLVLAYFFEIPQSSPRMYVGPK